MRCWRFRYKPRFTSNSIHIITPDQICVAFNDPNLKFEVIYGVLDPAFLPSTGENWVAGVQGNSAAGFFTQDFCNPVANVPPSNVSKTYAIPACGTPSPTPTATATATATATPTATGTPTP